MNKSIMCRRVKSAADFPEKVCPDCKMIDCGTVQGDALCGAPELPAADRGGEADVYGWYLLENDPRKLCVKVRVNIVHDVWLLNFVKGPAKDFYQAVAAVGGAVLGKTPLANLREDGVDLYRYSAT